MTLTAVKEERVSRVKEKTSVTEPVEVMAFCPGCKAFQTVWLNGNTLMSTRRFIQEGNQIYHNCGSDQACHLYFSW
jgi:hypothetical protein